MMQIEKIVIYTVVAIVLSYWGYDILFRPKTFYYPKIYSYGTDSLTVWTKGKSEGPIPKFVNKYKKRLFERGEK